MRHDEAITSLRQAYQKNPNNYVACINLGDLYYQLNDIKSAISSWKLGLQSPIYFYLIQRRLIYLNINSVQLKEWLAPQANFLDMHIIDL
jgi:lipopolysaccharide biosynthesis regulator YciM